MGQSGPTEDEGQGEPSTGTETTHARLTRAAAISGLVLAAVATIAVMTAATGSSSEGPENLGLELVREGTALADEGKHRKAIRALKGGMLELGGEAPERVLAKANFELGVALRKIGKFEQARKPLNRSRLFGTSAGAVGKQLAKAEAGIR